MYRRLCHNARRSRKNGKVEKVITYPRGGDNTTEAVDIEVDGDIGKENGDSRFPAA